MKIHNTDDENVIGYIPDETLKNETPILTAEQLEAIQRIEAAEDDIDDETVQKLLDI